MQHASWPTEKEIKERAIHKHRMPHDDQHDAYFTHQQASCMNSWRVGCTQAAAADVRGVATKTTNASAWLMYRPLRARAAVWGLQRFVRRTDIGTGMRVENLCADVGTAARTALRTLTGHMELQ